MRNPTARALFLMTLALTLVLTPLIAAPQAARADTTVGEWLDRLPEADAATARAIAEHLNGQWSVIRRDETARGVLEYETGALAKARAALADQTAAKTAADAALQSAQSSLDEAESVRANLEAMLAANDAYNAAKRASDQALKAEEAASAALDKAEQDLLAAQALSEEADLDYAEQSAAFDEAEKRLSALRDQTAKLTDSTDSDAVKTAQADLAAAELTHDAFAKQLAQYAEQADRAKTAAAEAEARHSQAYDAERAALNLIESANTALSEAQAARDAIQAIDDGLDALATDARAAVLKAQAALEAAQTLADQATEALAYRAEDSAEAESRFAAATDEASEAADELAALRGKWSRYASCIGAVRDAYPMPAMDLLAQAEAAPALYAVYLNGTRLYLFRPTAAGASAEPFLSVVLRENKTTVELTRNGKGTMSLRYISVDGKTHLQSLGPDVSAFMTGAYPVLAVDSQLRGITQYLGEAGVVNTTSMHGLTTLVQFGLDDPIRHAPRPQ